MSGQVIKRGDKRFLVRVPIGRDPETNTRLYHNKTIKGTKREAENYKNKILTEVSTGTFLVTADMTLSEYLDQWLETSAKNRLAKNSHVNYSYAVKKYVKPYLGKHKLKNLRPLDFQLLYSNLSKTISPVTVKYIHGVLRTAFNQALKWKLMNQSPLVGVDRPKTKRKEPIVLSIEQTQRFLKEVEESRYYLLFFFALITGMRPSEYCGLQWGDMDFENCTVTVRRTLVRVRKEQWHFGEPKTLAARRRIILPPKLMEGLKKEYERQRNVKADSPSFNPHDLVFLSSRNTPINHKNIINRHFKPALANAGLDTRLRLYDLRHMCASLLLSQNENIKVISERLGHSSIAITMDVYAHVLPSQQAAASNKIESLLLGTQTAHTPEKDEAEQAVS